MLHFLLTAAHGTHDASPAAPAAPMGGAAGMDGMDHGGGAPGLTMLLMHAVSVLVTSAWLE